MLCFELSWQPQLGIATIPLLQMKKPRLRGVKSLAKVARPGSAGLGLEPRLSGMACGHVSGSCYKRVMILRDIIQIEGLAPGYQARGWQAQLNLGRSEPQADLHAPAPSVDSHRW